MIIRIVFLFLIFIAVLAMFGRLRLPGRDRISRLPRPRICRHCGRTRLRRGNCPTCGSDERD